MGRKDDIQTALKSLKNTEKIGINYITIITVTLFEGLFSGKYK